MGKQAMRPGRVIKVQVIELPKDLGCYHLVKRFLELRKSVFIDRMRWPLSTYAGMEFEQYDTFFCTYVIAHRDGEVLGGARLVRTDFRNGSGKINYTYMIKDAHDGILPGLPNSICYYPPPTDPGVWELTRLACTGEKGLAARILKSANEFLHTHDARTCLFLGPPSFLRIAAGLGFSPESLGPIVGNDDGRFLAFQCPVQA